MNFICPISRLPLLNNGAKYSTANDTVIYPNLWEQVPILIANPVEAIHKEIIIYNKQINQLKNQINLLQKDLPRNEFRKDLTQKINAAFQYRIKTYQYFIKELLPISGFDNPENIPAQNIPKKKNYSINYTYPLRDLTSRAEDNKELKLILSTVHDLFSHHIGNVENSIILGAATCPLYKAVQPFSKNYCSMDIALNMPLYIKAIEQKAIDKIYEINNKNVSKTQNYIVPQEVNPNLNLADYNYLIADAQNLPFADQSIDVLIANYFTDTMPIWLILKEAKRVLKPNGYYLHFGPLRYHFNDIRLMYSEEEIKYIFEKENFKFLHENHIEEAHCNSPYNNVTNYSLNWIFLAQQKG